MRGRQREERVKEEEGREEEGGERKRDKVFSLVYKIYHSVRIEKHITYLPSTVSLGNCDINTERLASHAALSATHVMSNVHDIRLRMCITQLPMSVQLGLLHP